jgi:hypothetical protein
VAVPSISAEPLPLTLPSMVRVPRFGRGDLLAIEIHICDPEFFGYRLPVQAPPPKLPIGYTIDVRRCVTSPFKRPVVPCLYRRLRRRIIMGDDETDLLCLWREKRGKAEPEDLSAILIVQLGFARISTPSTMPKSPDQTDRPNGSFPVRAP